MHELSLCQALMSEVDAIARRENAVRVTAIVLGMGPLSGVDAQLLKHAYPVASAGTVAEGAELRIETTPLRVHCPQCGKESDAVANRLVCGHCGDWRTRLVSGDELLLVRVELDRLPDAAAGTAH